MKTTGRLLLLLAILVAAGGRDEMAVAQQSGASAPPTAAAAPRRPMIPDTFTNLQVLPKDITKPQLLTIMKGFAKNWNVRCSYCHVATDDLSEANFADDSKPTKQDTRELLRAIGTILKAPMPAPKASGGQ